MTMDEAMLKWLDLARIDIKNQSEGNDVKIAVVEGENCNVTRPQWFAKGGAGYVVETSDKHIVLELECHGAGSLLIRLQGVDRRAPGGGRLPLWVDYTELLVNGLEIFSGLKSQWHDKVFDFTQNVTDGEKIRVDISWNTHEYKGEDLIYLLNAYAPYNAQYLTPMERIRHYEETGYEDVDNDRGFLLWRRYEKPYLDELSNFNDLDADQQKIWKKNLRNPSRLDICRLVVVLGTRCTLRCRDCNNLMPYFKPQKDLPFEILMYSLKQMLKLADSIIRVELIGGEPFLSNNLEQALRFLLSQQHLRQIELTTNGTVLPSSEIVSLLQSEKILVRISDYGELSRKKEELIVLLKQYGIRYKILELEKWTSSGGIEARNHPVKLLKKGYFHCAPGFVCTTLYAGSLYACARSASLHGLGAMIEKEELSINAATTKEAIKGFLLKPYSLACDYCDGVLESKKKVVPAIQI